MCVIKVTLPHTNLKSNFHIIVRVWKTTLMYFCPVGMDRLVWLAAWKILIMIKSRAGSYITTWQPPS